MYDVLYQIVAVVSLLAGFMYSHKQSQLGFAIFIATLLLITLGISAKSGFRMWPEGAALFGASILCFIIGSCLLYRKEKAEQVTKAQPEEPGLDYKNFLQ